MQSLRASVLQVATPWLAVCLSYILPGAGHLLAGRIAGGVSIMVALAALVATASWTLFGEHGDLRFSAGCVVGIVALWLWSMYDAYVRAKSVMSRPNGSGVVKRRDPWLGALLSFLVPGLGHLYMRQWLLTPVFLVAFIATLTVPSISPFTSMFVSAIAAFTVYVFFSGRRKAGFVVAAALVGWYLAAEFFLAYVPPLLIQHTAHVEITPIAGDSMAPTLLDGDIVLVRSNKEYTPHTGDIIAIQDKDYPEIKKIKRVVALPGQTIEVKNKKIYINGTAQDQPGYESIEYSSWGRYGAKGRPYTVPENSYFLIGDNSLWSRDSRSIGAVRRSYVIGKAYKIIWPPHRWAQLVSGIGTKSPK